MWEALIGDTLSFIFFSLLFVGIAFELNNMKRSNMMLFISTFNVLLYGMRVFGLDIYAVRQSNVW